MIVNTNGKLNICPFMGNTDLRMCHQFAACMHEECICYEKETKTDILTNKVEEVRESCTRDATRYCRYWKQGDIDELNEHVEEK